MVESKESYVMGRDSHASGRLSLQHWLHTDQWGLIQPSIKRSWANADAETPRKIADVACGNALWAIEVAESGVAKNLQVVGFDVSAAQFPPPDNWPDNLTLHMWNMFEPPPKEYEGHFDLVNIRMVMIAVRDGDPRPILDNVLKLLKPGGFLQWNEVDLSSSSLPTDSIYQRLPELITRATGQSFQWIRNLGRLFEDAGLQEVEYASRFPRKSMQKFWNDNFVMGVTETARGMKSPDMDEWWIACEKERTERGVVALWLGVMSIGRKSI